MALNSSGPISLAGATAGQSIALELGLASTAVISLNDTDVRGLAGVPTGAISMPADFWGKSNATYWIANVTFSTATNVTVLGFTFDSSSNIYISGNATQGYPLFKIGNLGSFEWGKLLQSQVTTNSFSLQQLSLLNNGNIAAAGQLGYSSTREAAMRYEVSSANGAQVSCAGNYVGSLADTLNYSVIQASDGSVYTAGYQSSSSNTRMHISKFASMSASLPTWSYQVAVSTSTFWSVAIDSNNDVIGVGYVGSNASNTKYQIAKISASGTLIWAFQNSIFAVQRIFDVKCFGTNIYIVGYVTTATPTTDTIILKLDSSGTLQWARILTPPTSFGLLGFAIDVDSSENIYVSYNIQNNTGTTFNEGTGIAKYNSSGVIQWQRRFNRGVRQGNIQILNSNTFGFTCGATIATSYSSTDGVWVCVLPTDGSKTGTYVVNGKTVIYSASTFTDTAFSTTLAAGSVVAGITVVGNTSTLTNTTTAGTSVASNI